MVNALRFITDKAFEVLKNIDTDKTKVVWFGFTSYVDIIQKVFISKGKYIHCVIDNNSAKWGVSESGIIVFPVTQIVKKYKDNAIFFIQSGFKAEMRRQLLELGVEQSKIEILPSHEECDCLAREFLLNQTDGLKKIELREMQLILLDMLKVFRGFCEANGLRYFLAAGTLLGAIRHKGFIPWDDDADVYLPDNDYRRLIEMFPKGGRYEIENWETNPDLIIDFAKLSDNYTVKITGGYPIKNFLRVSLCIFPLCGYPDDENEFREKYHRNKFLDFKWYQCQWLNGLTAGEMRDLRGDIYDLKYNMPFDNSPLTGRTHLMHKPMWYVPHSVFLDRILVEFEEELFSAPIEYDTYLKAHYGEDYMQLPAESERISHGTIAFWKEKGGWP